TRRTTDDNGSVSYRTYDREVSQQIFSLDAGARHAGRSILVDYDVSVARSAQHGNFPTANFDGPDNVAFGVDLSDPYRPRFPVLNGVNIYNPSAYSLATWQAPANDPTSQRNLQGALNAARPYSSSSTTGLFEAGVKIRDENKTRVVTDQYYAATGSPALTIAQIPGGPTDPGYYFGAYQTGPLSDYTKLASFLAAN